MSDQHEEQPPRERLDVPFTSQLERRLLVGDALPQRPKRKPTIKPLPQSGLLNRLQAFLPTLEAANAGLEQQLAAGLPQADVAMERGSGDEGEGPYVEMDLACGLFDLKDASAVAAAERSLAGHDVTVEMYGGSGSDSDTDDSSSDDSEQEEQEEGEQLAGQDGAAPAAANQQHLSTNSGMAAAAGSDEAMAQAHAAAPIEGAAAAAAAAGAPAPASRRRKGKKQAAKRHAGIEELS